MSPTRADLEAVKLLGIEHRSHEKMAGLEGADLCWHRLAGSGEPADALPADAAARWTPLPYRHHVYTTAAPSDTIRTPDWCKCGNPITNPVHTKCWEGN